jgi:hypothetical protein
VGRLPTFGPDDMATSEAEDHDKLLLPAEVGQRRALLDSSKLDSGRVDSGRADASVSPPSGPQPGKQSASSQPASSQPASARDAGGSPQSGLRLTEIKEAILDDAELRKLFADIATYSRVEEVTMKASPRARSEVVRRLPELYLKLIERRVYGAQIRYEFDSGCWLDTLVTTPSGCRLVRVRLPD